MKISEMIQELQEILKEEGDLNLYLWNEDGDLEAPILTSMYNDLKDSANLGDCYPEISGGAFILIQ
jgi:hypothetical protein